jgi:uncharacterized repeat protein (TIGR03803 family)
MRSSLRLFGIGFWSMLCFLTAAASPSKGQVPTLLHSFTGGSDGSGPVSTLIRDDAGNLYGATFSGGGHGGFGQGSGTVFQLARDANGGWSERILYRFNGSSDGLNPYGALLLDGKGNLYGTTLGGGTHNLGTVYKLTPPTSHGGAWTEKVLYSFAGGNDGEAPYAGVIADAKGNLYGTTSGGGGTNSGTVFKLSPNGPSGWTESVLYTFGFLSGEGPYCRLVMDKNGNLYGTTFRGGNNDGGTVFELSLVAGGWNITFIHHFANLFGGNGDGSEPFAGVIIDGSGNLYGTTLGGGTYSVGVVFELSPLQGSWQEQVLHSFAGNSDGFFPYGILAFGPSNSLYGTTEFGGGLGQCAYHTLAYCGTVFKMTRSGSNWSESINLSFDGTGPFGFSPVAGVLVNTDGTLYVTPDVGGTNDDGTILAIAP